MGNAKSKAVEKLSSSPIDNVSDDQINRLVEEFMQNDKINNDIIPDFIEKKIYFNCIKLVLCTLEQTLKSTSIEFLGHTLKISLETKKDL